MRRRSVLRRGLGVLLPALAAAIALAAPATAQAQTRVYWIAAVPVTWNVVPNGHDVMTGMEFPTDQTTLQTVVYKAYTPWWGKPLPDVPWIIGDNDGIPGPTIHARVGDDILVHFKNLDFVFKRPHSMHFHGVEYDPSSDGAYIPGFSGPGAEVMPGSSFTYVLHAGPESAGVWPYHDHSPSMEESIAGGLYGALSILGLHDRRPDKEFVIFFESMLNFMTINGHAFLGNTPVPHARVGDLVQWDVLALGDDFHTFHIHGHRWLDRSGVPRDTQIVGPAESYRIRFVEDHPGPWLYHCHVESHMMNGMIGLYVVRK